MTWRFLPPERGDDRALPRFASHIEIKPFSRRFWCVLWRKVDAGERVTFLLEQAMRGEGYWVRSGDPSLVEDESLVAVVVESEQYAAWVEYASSVGFRLVKPDQAPVIWCPSETPPPPARETTPAMEVAR